MSESGKPNGVLTCAAVSPPSADTVVATLRAHEARIRRLGILSLYLFGSVARDEARAGSDVDLFCDYDAETFSLISLARAQRELGEFLGAEVDLTTRDSLRPHVRPNAEANAVRIF